MEVKVDSASIPLEIYWNAEGKLVVKWQGDYGQQHIAVIKAECHDPPVQKGELKR